MALASGPRRARRLNSAARIGTVAVQLLLLAVGAAAVAATTACVRAASPFCMPHTSQTGFSDANAYIRELTLKSMLSLAPKLTNKTLVNNVLKHLSKLQVRGACTRVGARVGKLISRVGTLAETDSAAPSACRCGVAGAAATPPHAADAHISSPFLSLPLLSLPSISCLGGRWTRSPQSVPTPRCCWATLRATWARPRAGACSSTPSRARSR